MFINRIDDCQEFFHDHLHSKLVAHFTFSIFANERLGEIWYFAFAHIAALYDLK